MSTWEAQLARDLGVPAGQATTLAEQKFDIWERAEGGLQPEHANNPFNTSLDSASYPHVPTTNIPEYPSIGVGVQKTSQTLLDSDPAYGYGAIVQNLRSGGSLQDFARALTASSWAGSHYQGNALIQGILNGADPGGAAASGINPGTQTQQSTGTSSAAGSQSGATDVSLTSLIPGASGVEKLVIRALEIVGGLGLVLLGGAGLFLALKSSGGAQSAGQIAAILKANSPGGGGSSTPSRGSSSSGQAESPATPERPISQQPRRVQRRAGFEPANSPDRARRERREARRAAVARAKPSDDVPF